MLVWQARPPADQVPAQESAWYRLLDAAERRRADRLARPADRLAYVTAHGLLRMALSSCAPVAPERWTFHADFGRRPEIAAPPGMEELRFGLSHTDGLAAAAVARAARVGVDVERMKFDGGIEEAAETFLSAQERAACGALGPEALTVRLYEHWTLKEALAKAVGLGLALEPATIGFDVCGPGGPRLTQAPAGVGKAWRFFLWAPTPEHRLAAAVEGTGPVELVRKFVEAPVGGG